MAAHKHYIGLIERYKDRLPVSATTRVISLNEGNTPMIQLQNIPRMLGKDVDIYVKFEGLNPTGSFKDRGMTMAVTKAVEEGSEAIICASTGNTSASAAAYAARAGIKAFVLTRVLTGVMRNLRVRAGSWMLPAGSSLLNHHEQRRCQQQTEGGNAKHAEEDRDADGMAHLGAGAGGKYQRHDTGDERDGGHENGA